MAHGFVGGLVALAAPARLRRGRAVWGLPVFTALVAAAPDLDVIGYWLGVPYEHALGHRGLSHSIPFALLAGWACAWGLRRFGYGPAVSRREFWRLAVICAAACASHGLLDRFTDAGLGVGLWLPFSNERSFAGFRPIPTSALSVSAAFSRRGAEILAAEALWIGLPAATIALGAAGARRALAARQGRRGAHR